MDIFLKFKINECFSGNFVISHWMKHFWMHIWMSSLITDYNLRVNWHFSIGSFFPLNFNFMSIRLISVIWHEFQFDWKTDIYGIFRFLWQFSNWYIAVLVSLLIKRHVEFIGQSIWKLIELYYKFKVHIRRKMKTMKIFSQFLGGLA